MSELKIFYTFKEYEKNFNDSLSLFLTDYFDSNELDFLIEQKELYKICIENVVIIQDGLGNYFIKSKFLGINMIDEILNKVSDNFILAKKLNRSFIEIYNFIIEQERVYRIVNNIPFEKEIESNSETHSDIFKKSGFVLFDYILNNYVRNRRGRKSDLNFYYRKLYNDDFIIESCRAENFKEWYEINYNDDFGQIKTLSEVENESRNQNYTTSLEWFKQSKL